MAESTTQKSISEQFIETLLLIHINFFRKKQLPLPLNQYGVLMAAYTEESLTASDACDILKISKQQMSSLVERLVQSGYIRKESDPEDRRRSLLRLTNKARKLIDRQNSDVQQDFDASIGNLTPSEQHLLAESIGNFNRLLEKMFA